MLELKESVETNQFCGGFWNLFTSSQWPVRDLEGAFKSIIFPHTGDYHPFLDGWFPSILGRLPYPSNSPYLPHNPSTCYSLIYEISGPKRWSRTSPNMYLSLNNFLYFPHSLTKLSDFVPLDLQMFFWASEVSEQCRKHRRLWVMICFKPFEKIVLDPFSSAPIFWSFLVCFEWFKTWWVPQLGLYKTYFYSTAKDATIKNF